MKQWNMLARIASLGVLFVLICTVYLITLVNIQITGQDYYEIVHAETYTRYVSIEAKRGEIYDRNGKALVINTQNENIALEYGAMPSGKAAFNEVILTVHRAIIEGGGAGELTEPIFPYTGSYPNYTRDEDFFASATNRTKFSSLLRRLERDENITDEELLDYLRVRYGMLLYDKATKTYYENDAYTAEEADLLLRTRFAMEYIQFSRVEPYVFAENVTHTTLTYVLELSIPQILITEEPMRTYVYPGYASHILGRIGKIPADKADTYQELGYSADAYVGITGVEAAYEEYLHGVDGTMEIIEDAYGNLISETVIREPVTGNDIYLTIDIDLQISTEDALADNIEIIREKGRDDKDPYSGEDASAGAAVAIDPGTGAVLAIASYPTFDLSAYFSNYTAYSEDPLQPLLNRALYGTYTPGSTFKPGVAAAALTEGVITANTVIVDRGAYDFGSYHPRCWIYLQKGRTHGAQTVVEAIQNSCNYFFYEVGNRLGIEKMNQYCRSYGLGQPTGIELGEAVGILAGPDYSDSVGDIWNPGNTLQAAIGQSDNMFTPLQLSVYISTLLNNGTRYRAHLLDTVRAFPSGETVYETPIEVQGYATFGANVINTVKTGMKDVVESGSAARIFRGYDIKVGGKTGTAQVSTVKSDNALFVGFAPYDDPQIVTAVVIEQGANGTDAAYTAKAMFDAYLKGEAYQPLHDKSDPLP